MSLHHAVDLAYGIEIPTTTDLDAIDNALSNQPTPTAHVSYVVVGDRDQLLLVTRSTDIEENTVVRLTTDTLAQPFELATWEQALHDVAVRLGHADHPEPAWLVIHNYR